MCVISLEAHSLQSSDSAAIKPALSDLNLAAINPGDSKRSLAAAEAPAQRAAQSTIEQQFGSLQIIDSAASSKNKGDASGPVADSDVKAVQQRIDEAPYPRIAQMWHPADPQPGKTAEQVTAEHSFVLASAESLGLKWQTGSSGQGTEFTKESIVQADAKHQALLKLNPDMVTVVELRYHDAPPVTYPQNSPFWQHGKDGKPLPNPDYKQFQMLDWTNPDFQKHVVEQAVAAVKSGAADGVMLDWWNDGRDTQADKAAKMKMLEEVRQAVGPDALIMINTNEKTLPEIMPDFTKAGSAGGKPLVNGYYMESMGSATSDPKKQKAEYQKIAQTLEYSQQNTLSPHITVVETWHDPKQVRDDPKHLQEQLQQMRAGTTLVMALSNDYSLYADPDGMKDTQGKSIPDHGHEIYSFYQANLGAPVSETPPALSSTPGAIEREFHNGTVVCNTLGDVAAEVRFKDDRKQMSTGKIIKAGSLVQVEPGDGDIFVKTDI